MAVINFYDIIYYINTKQGIFMKKIKGFTLIELLITIAIIAILVGIALPKFLNFREKVVRSTAESDSSLIRLKLIEYLEVNGTYPDNTELANIEIRMSPDNIFFGYIRDTSEVKYFLFNVSNSKYDGKYIDYDYNSNTLGRSNWEID